MFTFNTVTAASMGLGVRGVRRSVLPSIGRSRLTVAGMPGSYLMQTTLEERMIEFDVWYVGESLSDASADGHSLAEWLYTNEPVELSLEDDPGLIYYAVLDGSTDLDAIHTFRAGTLRFSTDPYAYAADATETTITAIGDTTVTNSGGVDTFPVIDVTLGGDTSFVEVRCTETGEFVRLGTPADADTTPTDPTTLDFDDDCSEMDWTPSTVTRDGDTKLPGDGSNPMVMVVNATSDAFSPGSAGGNYGTGAAWHGPTVVRSLSSAATDFRVEARLKLIETAASLGRAEILLLDSSDNILGFVGVFDAWASIAQVNWRGATGETEPTSRRIYTPTQSGDGGDYEYEMTIQRIGNVWTATNTLLWYPPVGATERWNFEQRAWVDDGTYDADLAKVGIHIAARSTSAVPTMHCSNVTVRHLNAVTGSDVPIVAYEDDVVRFDMRQARVTVGGSDNSIVPDVSGNPLPVSALIDLESTFFALPAGESTIHVSADDGVTATGTITHTERWL